MSKKSGSDSDSSEELKKIANLKISDDDKLNEMVVAIDEAPLYDDNDKLFRGKFRNMKIAPITHTKRAYSPMLPSPLSPISSGNNTPKSLTSMGSVGSLSEPTDKAVAPKKNEKRVSSFVSRM